MWMATETEREPPLQRSSEKQTGSLREMLKEKVRVMGWLIQMLRGWYGVTERRIQKWTDSCLETRTVRVRGMVKRTLKLRGFPREKLRDFLMVRDSQTPRWSDFPMDWLREKVRAMAKVIQRD